MKNVFIFFIALAAFSCSPKLSPDAGWGHQRWVLVQMKGVPVQQSGGRRDAYISFEVGEKRFNGNGGCNQINGNYTIDKREIKFADIISTKMSCNDIEFENTFLSILGGINRYEVKGNELLLKNRRDIQLVLRPQ